MKATYLTLGVIVLLAFGIVRFVTGGFERQTTIQKVPHYESNTPAAGAILPVPPPGVVIDVNFDLGAGSQIAILHSGTDYGVGETTIDDNKLALRRSMQADSPDGTYTVTYQACWPDGSCHDGFYPFEVDRATLTTLADRRGEATITIDMKKLQFDSSAVRISSGTTITWKNLDAVTHYVNTDSHPAHTHVLDFNSSALEEAASYAYTFTTPGAYPYHCSAHAGTMTGIIVVE